MKPRLFALAASAALVAASSVASAHAVLINPPPLTNDDNAKAGPCGCYFGAGPEDPNEDGTASACPADYKVTDLVAGSTIQVAWKETVQHTGKFRIAISPMPINEVTRAEMDGRVEYDEADMNSQSGGLITTMLVVPEMSCDNCALQLRQFMENAAKPYYYSCAAVNIKPASGAASSSSSSTTGAGGGGAGGGGMGGSGTGEGGSVGPGPAAQPPATESGACSMSTSSRTGDALPIAALAILGLVARRRRRS